VVSELRRWWAQYSAEINQGIILMTGTEIAQILTSSATFVAALGGVMVSLRNSRKIEEVHKSTDGKVDQLVSVVKEASFARGVKSEQDKNNGTPP
jgi:hypothetical protein